MTESPVCESRLLTHCRRQAFSTQGNLLDLIKGMGLYRSVAVYNRVRERRKGVG